MVEKDILIVNKLGLHARAAAKLVSLASIFKADIDLTRDGRTVNGKSIMGVMMLAASKGTGAAGQSDMAAPPPASGGCCGGGCACGS